MTNRKNTRRALVLSLLSLLVCCSMLVGTTFAWFTDSVTSGSNQIVAGNLDIELEYSKDMANWASVSNATELFSDTLWEPGHTQVVYLRMRNLGTLALKYNFSMNFTDTVIGTSVEGNEIKLSEHLKYDIVEVAAAYADRDAARAAVEQTAEVLSVYTVSGKMLPGDADKVMALVIYMPEEVGNEANYRGQAVPQIDLGLNLYATQQMHEEDSFDETYDKNAGWLGEADTSWYNETDTEFVITTAEQLAGLAKLVNGGNSFAGKTVKLGDDISLAGNAWTPIGTKAAHFKGTFDGQNYTVSGMTVKTSTYAGLFGYARTNTAAAPTTIKNVKIDGAEVTAVPNADFDAYAGAVLAYGTGSSSQGKVVVTGVTVTNSELSGKSTGSVVGAFGVLGEISACSAQYCDLYGSRIGGIVGAMGEVSALSDCTVDEISKTVKFAGDESYYCMGVYVGRVTGGASVPADNASVTENLVKDNTTLDEAIKAGKTTIYLKKGNYNIPDSAQGKTLTIVGTKDVKIGVMHDGSYEGCDYSADGSTITFEGVTICTNSTTYAGYARMVGIYNDCTFEGTYTTYRTSEFNNCTFNISGDLYNLWTWGAPAVTFNGCTFNSDGKAVLLYGQENTVLTLNDCVFNDKGGLADLKAAIEIGNDYNKSYQLIVNNTVVNGYEINDKGINTGSTLWGNKNSMGTDKLNVVVDGVDVY